MSDEKRIIMFVQWFNKKRQPYEHKMTGLGFVLNNPKWRTILKNYGF
jgi:hypothetical protein